MNVIDLFSGCGGLSKGFMDAGCDVLLGVDIDQAALNTFEKNHPGACGLNGSLADSPTFKKMSKIIGSRKVDLIVGGPPCQGFSLTGPRNFDDERNKLYLSYIKAVELFRPKGFIIENVPGMATLYKGEVKEEILKRFRKLGYNIDCKVLCAADFGVPQLRRRLVFIGIRKEYGEVSFPSPIVDPKHYVTSREAIDDLPSLADELGTEVSSYCQKARTEYQKKMRGKCDTLLNHTATEHKDFVKKVIAQVPEGGNYKDLPVGVGEHRKFHMAWTRCDGHKPSRTIDTGHRNYFHYEQNRIPTVRESARLQSFPDDFVFTGTRTQQYRQVGNAVPPLLGYALAKHLIKLVSKENG